MQTHDRRKLVLLDAFYRKVKVFREAFAGVDDTKTVLAILFETFNFIDAIGRLEKKDVVQLKGGYYMTKSKKKPIKTKIKKKSTGKQWNCVLKPGKEHNNSFPECKHLLEGQKKNNV